MMIYFKNCFTAEDVKKTYYEWTKKSTPATELSDKIKYHRK